MTTDPIIEELHQIREEIAAEFNYDVFAIGAMLQARQQEEGKPIVSFTNKSAELDRKLTDQTVRMAA